MVAGFHPRTDLVQDVDLARLAVAQLHCIGVRIVPLRVYGPMLTEFS